MAKKAKRLPRREGGDFERCFQAGGHTYTILSPEEGVGIRRFSMLTNMSMSVAFEMSAANMYRNLQKVLDYLWGMMQGRNELAELVAHVKTMLDGLQETQRKEYASIFWTACLFVVRQGEELSSFTEAEQQQKIDDWNAEGFHEQDFHELVKKKLPKFLAPLPESKSDAP